MVVIALVLYANFYADAQNLFEEILKRIIGSIFHADLYITLLGTFHTDLYITLLGTFHTDLYITLLGTFHTNPYITLRCIFHTNLQRTLLWGSGISICICTGGEHE